ncbi:transcription factor bHLH94-like [Silene latifolia]|uniref:transcription factor bHLH94-like n=1 Tax=Silene latifolia TaxID=37657 RepID=UPI003D7899D9
MALEAVLFSQDPLTSYNVHSTSNNFGINYNELANYSPFGNFNVDNFDLSNSDTSNNNPVILVDNVDQWDHHYHNYQPQEEHLADEPSGPPVSPGPRKKRRRRSNKNKEEVEQQRMTHIAVERNRRKQMNDYLAVIRSLMPPSYVQRGDQASIVGGAINYVKELEQMLQSMEALKNKKMQHHHDYDHHDEEKSPPIGGDIEDNNKNNAAPEVIFADFFSYPQYSTRSNQSEGSNSAVISGEVVKGEIEVTMVDSHANVKILTKKQPKQLVKLIANFQGLRLNVLHLNVTTLDSFVLYSLSLKVEEGCQLKSVDDIAAASNHILGQIQEEAATRSTLIN